MTKADVSDVVVLSGGDRRARRALYRILCATGATAQFVDRSEDVMEGAGSTRLRMLDYDSLRDGATRLLEKLKDVEHRPSVLVLTSSHDKKDLIELFSYEMLTNVAVKSIGLSMTEIAVTVRKILTNDIFGIEKYLTWGSQPHYQTLCSPVDRVKTLNLLKIICASSRAIGDSRLSLGPWATSYS